MSVNPGFIRQCRWLRAATLFVFVCLLVLLALVGLGGFSAGALATASPGQRAVLALVRLLPGLGYLWALWAVQRALADLAAGRLFHPTVARAMRHVGIGVLVGALASVFGFTNAARWLLGVQGSYAYFDLSGIVLGVVGAALVLLARLVDQARALQAELDEIP